MLASIILRDTMVDVCSVRSVENLSFSSNIITYLLNSQLIFFLLRHLLGILLVQSNVIIHHYYYPLIRDAMFVNHLIRVAYIS